MDVPPRTLVISDGGVGSLVACMAAREALYAAASAQAGASRAPEGDSLSVGLRARRPLVFMGELPPATGTARRRAVERQCAALDLELIDPAPVDVPPSDAPAGERVTRLLLCAGFAAARRDVARVVWPVHFFDGNDVDLDGVSGAIDRAILVTRLLGLDSRPGVRVEAPYADFTDRQLAELAVDLDAPLRTCWWWHAQLAGAQAGEPSGVDLFRTEHRRWAGLFREAGWLQDVEAA